MSYTQHTTVNEDRFWEKVIALVPEAEDHLNALVARVDSTAYDRGYADGEGNNDN